ncbi:hypothetical protein DPMN_150811 [Dreissena polymorpha]|uniref:Uncharacterized protein n=1 Tax=Dreissena polymorpha TaxID=45954 RepID=A0A9D4FGE2_DREPO|nr:hypothetical protein DPMN_150811 [Dreissena polymorpha]
MFYHLSYLIIILKVVPVESSLIEEIQASAGEKAPNIVLSASPMLIISVKDLEPGKDFIHHTNMTVS